MPELPFGIIEINTPHYQTVSGYKFPTLQQAIRHQVRENLIEFFGTKSDLSSGACTEVTDCILKYPEILVESIKILEKHDEHNI